MVNGGDASRATTVANLATVGDGMPSERPLALPALGVWRSRIGCSSSTYTASTCRISRCALVEPLS
jgi:hypothetical protein